MWMRSANLNLMQRGEEAAANKNNNKKWVIVQITAQQYWTAPAYACKWILSKAVLLWLCVRAIAEQGGAV